MIVVNYVDEVLTNNLTRLGLQSGIDFILQDIQQRLNSVLLHWRDKNFRDTILFSGVEIANRFMPSSASMTAKTLVVVCVRNSYLEDLHAENPFIKNVPRRFLEMKLIQWIDDVQIRRIMEESIEYWNIALKGEIAADNSPTDIFGEYPEKYPLAWRAFYELAKLSENNIESHYPPMDSLPSYPELLKNAPITNAKESLIESGISPEIDPILAHKLSGIHRGEKQQLFTPSFKHLTRNTDKLFKVLDFILSRNGEYFSPNYFMSNGYVSRRKKLGKIIHNKDELDNVLANKWGLSKRHLEALSF